MEPIIGISCLHYKWMNISEAFERCVSEFGLDALEFSYPNAVSDSDLESIRKLNKRYQLKLSLHVWDDIAKLGEKIGYQKMLHSLDICREINASLLTIHLGTYPDREEGLRIAGEVFCRSAILYEKAGIDICLENHFPYDYKGTNSLGGTPSELLLILNKVRSSALKLCLDYGHANMNGNILEFVKELGSFIGLVHVADNHGFEDEHLPYGDGNVDWDKVLVATLRAGFVGPYIIEFGNRDDCVERFKTFASDLRDLSLTTTPT